MKRIRLLLLPFSLLYGLIMKVRNLFFEIGLMRQVKVQSTVISIGNISVGGSGKTTLVEYIVKQLHDKNYKVAVLSRGYKRKTKGYVVVSDGISLRANLYDAGDEPYQIATKFRDVPVVVDEKRVRGAKNIVRDFKSQYLVLDDGFQHRYLMRDLDIVVLSIEDLMNPDFLLPAGNNRECLSAISRADAVLLSGWDSKNEFQECAKKINNQYKKPVFGMQYYPLGLECINSSEIIDKVKLERKTAMAFSGIGNPASFEKTLQLSGMIINRHRKYPDHHNYTNVEIDEIISEFKNIKTDYLVTTQKDMTRLKDIWIKEIPIYFLKIEPKIIDEQSLLNLILRN